METDGGGGRVGGSCRGIVGLKPDLPTYRDGGATDCGSLSGRASVGLMAFCSSTLRQSVLALYRAAWSDCVEWAEADTGNCIARRQ